MVEALSLGCDKRPESGCLLGTSCHYQLSPSGRNMPDNDYCDWVKGKCVLVVDADDDDDDGASG